MWGWAGLDTDNAGYLLLLHSSGLLGTTQLQRKINHGMNFLLHSDINVTAIHGRKQQIPIKQFVSMELSLP